MNSRELFEEQWLYELPQRIAPTDLFQQLHYSINDLISHQVPVIGVGKNAKKLELSSVVYYWIEDSQGPVLIGEFSKNQNLLVVNAVGKRSNTNNVWASDLYSLVLSDIDGSIVSDVTLTDKGLNIWRRLLSAGYPISVYDKTAPGASHILIKTVNDFDQYFSNNPEYRKYRFIVSKNINEAIEVRAQFLTRRTRELAGMI